MARVHESAKITLDTCVHSPAATEDRLRDAIEMGYRIASTVHRLERAFGWPRRGRRTGEFAPPTLTTQLRTRGDDLADSGAGAYCDLLGVERCGAIQSARGDEEVTDGDAMTKDATEPKAMADVAGQDVAAAASPYRAGTSRSPSPKSGHSALRLTPRVAPRPPRAAAVPT